MTFAKAAGTEYEARLRRLEHLSNSPSPVSEILNFYREILVFQKGLSAQVERAARSHGVGAISNGQRGELDLAAVLPHFRGLLGIVEAKAPVTLAQAARRLAELQSDAWVALLTAYWEVGGRNDQQIGAFAEFFPRVLVQPLAEMTARAAMLNPGSLGASKLCPICGARPLAGVLRQEGDGGKRFLLCSFCSNEWEFRRILCPVCGEEDEKKLPVFSAEELPHLRVECCETCKFYTRTIDLTKDGNAVPIVDDLAAVPLTLWADERGYSRLQPNLLGT
jgi:formate dehydrogenase maturation protein FdhE